MNKRPTTLLFFILGACLFFMAVALDRFEDRLAAAEAVLGIDHGPTVIEDMR